MEIKITRTTAPKAKPADESKLGFGKTFTDHMFIMEYDEGQGWHDPRIVPFGDISLSPAAMVFHYGQEVFEGLKAYRTADNKIQLFKAYRTAPLTTRFSFSDLTETLHVLTPPTSVSAFPQLTRNSALRLSRSLSR